MHSTHSLLILRGEKVFLLFRTHKNNYWFLLHWALRGFRNSKRRKNPWISILNISSPRKPKSRNRHPFKVRPKGHAKKYISRPHCLKSIHGRRGRPSSLFRLFHEYRDSPGLSSPSCWEATIHVHVQQGDFSHNWFTDNQQLERCTRSIYISNLYLRFWFIVGLGLSGHFLLLSLLLCS